MRNSGSFLPRGKERVDQQRKVGAVAAFEDGGGGQAGFTKPATEGGEIFEFESHGGDGIADVGVEAGGDEEKLGREGDGGVERGAQGGEMDRARRTRCDGPVAAVIEGAQARAGIAGRLVDRGEENAGASVENRLGAVAVVGVEIPDGDARGVKFLANVAGGDSDVVEVTKTHRLLAGGVMAGRAHERKCRQPVQERNLGGGDRGTDGAQGVFGDAGEMGRVGVEVARLEEALKVLGRVSEQQALERWCGRLAPGPIGMRGAEVRRGFGDPRGFLGAHRGTVIDGARIVKDQHDGMAAKRRRRRKKPSRDRVLFLRFLRLFAAMRRMKVVVLCSGGMDSVAALYWAAREHVVVAVASFDYGSKHNHRELPLAREHAEKLGVRHETIALDFVNRLFASDLLKSGGDVPEGHYAAENMKQTVVPFRNAIMLSIACGFAESAGAEGLVIAAHTGDHTIYPDCREDFMAAMADAMRLGTYAGVRLLRPFIALTKAEIASEGARLGVDFARTWSCYKGGAIHCGKCGTCVERREAFALAGLVDPTVYENVETLPERPI